MSDTRRRPAGRPEMSNREQKQQQYLQMQEKRKKIKRRIRAIIALVFFVLILAALYFGFRVKTMEITGDTYCSQSDIREWIDEDMLSGNTLYLYVKYRFSNYKKFPGIEQMDVTFTDPWNVKIKVYEKTIIGCVKDGADYAYFDMDGTVLAIQSEKVDKIVEIKGLNVEKIVRYKILPVKDKSVFKHMLLVAKALDKTELYPADIKWRSSNVTMNMGNITVELGMENLEDKIAQLPPILKKLKKEKGTLDLRQYEGIGSTISFKPDNSKTEN